MTCKTETKQIGEREYNVTQWPATKSMLIKLKLIETFGVSLGKLATISQDKKQNKNQEIEALTESLNSLFSSASPETIVDLMKQCLEGVAVDGVRLTKTSIDQVFSPDDLMEIYKVFIFVIQVNYGNFIKGQWADNLLAKVNQSL